MTRSPILSAVTLAAVTLACLSTASLAQDAPAPKLFFNFDDIDADKDDKVTRAELEAHRAAKAAAMDTNADGKLNAAELAAAHVKRATDKAAERSARMIERLDTDGDKALSTAELAAGPRTEGLFERADTDADGAISRAEAAATRAKMKHRHADRHGGWGWMRGGN